MIINPIWFYLIGVSSNLQIACTVIAISLVIVFIDVLMYQILEDIGTDFKGWRSKLLIIGIICTFISILIPSKETCYQMMVASFITKENIEKTAEAGKEAIDYIVNSIDKLLDEPEGD